MGILVFHGRMIMSAVSGVMVMSAVVGHGRVAMGFCLLMGSVIRSSVSVVMLMGAMVVLFSLVLFCVIFHFDLEKCV